MESSKQILVVRHGERCDFTFNQQGINWMRRAFDANGKYRAFDLNLPRMLPKRKDGYQNFASDAPLTEMGYLQSKLTGRGILESKINVDYVYCSPALRCVQTAVGLLKGMNSRDLKMNIEPGLFEWTQWCRSGVPSWMSPDELERIGYPVNTQYVSCMRPEELCIKETVDDFYERSYKVVREITKRCNGTFLLVAHSSSLDTLTRKLCGGSPRTQQEFLLIVRQTSYLACALAKEKANKSWSLCPSPILPLTHSANLSYDPRFVFSHYFIYLFINYYYYYYFFFFFFFFASFVHESFFCRTLLFLLCFEISEHL